MNPAWPLLVGILGLLAASAQAAEPVTFADALYKKFHHERCLQCHQFSSRKHNGRAYGSHRSRYLCDNCHTRHITGLGRGEWMAPTERFDYTGLDAAATCRFIKRNAGASDAPARLAEHLLHDSRIHWALDSGMTPAGRFPTVPGGSEAWLRDVRAWIEGGMACE